MVKQSLNMLIKWVKMEKNIRKLIKSWNFQLAYTNLKILRKVREIVRRQTTVRRWYLETLRLGIREFKRFLR